MLQIESEYGVGVCMSGESATSVGWTGACGGIMPTGGFAHLSLSRSYA